MLLNFFQGVWRMEFDTGTPEKSTFAFSTYVEGMGQHWQVDAAGEEPHTGHVRT